jgi:acyl-coenzyme A synthetase/AMP-(fatty) acid ligase
MKMLQPQASFLWHALNEAGGMQGRQLWAPSCEFALSALAHNSCLGGRLEELRGRSILIATKHQLTAALALIELDGVARRIVLCPPDTSAQDLSYIAAVAGVDIILAEPDSTVDVEAVPNFSCSADVLVPMQSVRRSTECTEWVLLTSGTTGLPKLVVHTFATLTGAILPPSLGARAVWSTFYDIRRYGGLQIFLRAMLCRGGFMVFSSPTESPADFLARAAAFGVTHISGTPTHWRRALMSQSADQMKPRYIRLSGEIADQAILDHLRIAYPKADIAHAFASTEAGVAFDVGDGLAGFPVSFVEPPFGAVEMRVENDSLRIRSARTARGYLGDGILDIYDAHGFVDTGDIVEVRKDRYHFIGRRGGIINIGGLKVHPEEVEAVINSQPHVQISLVRARRNPITGTIVVADVVTVPEVGDYPVFSVESLKRSIIKSCRHALPRYKVPAVINIVPTLDVAASGKLIRPHA